MTTTDTERAKRDADARALAGFCKAAKLSPAKVLSIVVHEMASQDWQDTAATLRKLADALELLHAEPTGEIH